MTRSLLAHCAVSGEEVALWQKNFPGRHAACMASQPGLYGNGSRSHTRRRVRQLRARRLGESPLPMKKGKAGQYPLPSETAYPQLAHLREAAELRAESQRAAEGAAAAQEAATQQATPTHEERALKAAATQSRKAAALQQQQQGAAALAVTQQGRRLDSRQHACASGTHRPCH